MVILNFGHPLTEEQRTQIQALCGAIAKIHDITVQIDEVKPLQEQISALVDVIQLSPQEWQSLPLLINPPGYAPAALVLLAELHGRMGHFPSLIRLRPTVGTVTTYEVAELLNLQSIRDAARKHR